MHPLLNEGRAWASLARMLREENPDADEDTIHDTVDGELDFDGIASWMLRRVGERQASITALQDYIGELQERAKRLEQADRRDRNVIRDAMNTAGLKSLAMPEATLSVRAGKAKVIVTDENLLPDWAWTTPKPVPDKNAIGSQMDTEPVPGAEWSNAEPSLTIRRK